jgi:hypothetical protein
MRNKFVIFSIELGPSLDPQSLEIPLEKMVVFDKDPIDAGGSSASYKPYSGSTTRGSVIPTLGGVIIQDFGSQIMDQRIIFSDTAAISKATVDALVALEAISGREYYFTDGYDCFKVQFARPLGFVYQRNLITSFYNKALFDYTINLVVKDHENV